MAPFFAELQPDPAIAGTYILLQELEASLRLRGRTNDSLKVALLYADLRAGYQRLSVTAAERVEELIRERIRATSVRPPTSGALEGAIRAQPLHTSIPAGAVSIGDIAVLDEATTRERRGRVYKPYWWAQERGYAGNVGREVRGFFTTGSGDRHPASGAQKRMHPYFEAQKGPKMIIGDPIEPRHFLRDGIANLLPEYLAEASRIQGNALTKLGQATTHR